MLEFVLNKNEFVKCRKEFIIREIFFWTFKNIYEANKLSKKIDNNSLYYYIINKEE